MNVHDPYLRNVMRVRREKGPCLLTARQCELVEQESTFLTEYLVLIRKHGRFVWACGCCNSPALAELEEEDDPAVTIAEHLQQLRTI